MSLKEDKKWDSCLDHFVDFWWSEVLKKVKDAIVFIDNAAAECLHWNKNGAQALFHAGALGVKELSPLETGTKEQQKAVFIASEAVSGITEMAIRDIILGSRFEHCIVITAAPATIHTSIRTTDGPPADDPNNLRAFVELENRLLRWMGNSTYTSEVFYYPLFAARLMENFFIMPPFSDFMGEVGHEAQEKHFNANSKQINHMAACLHSLMAFLSAREDVFCVGELSAAVAAELESLAAAKTRRKTAQNRVSVVMFDRCLDLATGCNLDPSSCLLDRVLAVLPTFPGHTAERCVDMSQLCYASNKAPPGLPLPLVPGCALQPGQISHLIEAGSLKEGLMGLQRRILEVSSGTPTIRVTIDSISKRAKALALHGGLQQHVALLQQCLGVVQSASGPQASSFELLAGLQKVLIQNLAVEDEEIGFVDVIQQVAALIRTRKERGLPLQEIVMLLIHTFSAVGPDQALRYAASEELENAKKTLAEALLEDCTEIENNWPGVIKDEVQATSVSEDVFKKLYAISDARNNLTTYRNILTRQSSLQPARITPLLPTIVKDCVDRHKGELSQDITCSISGSSRGALGLFLGSSKPHPCDGQMIIVLVLGGITGNEVRTICNIAKESGKKLLIGATRLSSPKDCLHFAQPSSLVTPRLG